jgi:hypothetical protein
VALTLFDILPESVDLTASTANVRWHQLVNQKGRLVKVFGYRGSEAWFGYLESELPTAPCGECGGVGGHVPKTWYGETEVNCYGLPSMAYHGVTRYPMAEYRAVALTMTTAQVRKLMVSLQ